MGCGVAAISRRSRPASRATSRRAASEPAARAARSRRGRPGARGCPRARSAGPCSARRAGGAPRARARAAAWRATNSAKPTVAPLAAAGAARQRSRSSRGGAGSPRRCGSGRGRERRIRRCAHAVRIARVAEPSRSDQRAARTPSRLAAATRRAAARAARRRPPRARLERRGRRSPRRGARRESRSHSDCAPLGPRGARSTPRSRRSLERGSRRRAGTRRARPQRAMLGSRGHCQPVRRPRSALAAAPGRLPSLPWRGSSRSLSAPRVRKSTASCASARTPSDERALVDQEARRVVRGGVARGDFRIAHAEQEEHAGHAARDRRRSPRRRSDGTSRRTRSCARRALERRRHPSARARDRSTSSGCPRRSSPPPSRPRLRDALATRRPSRAALAHALVEARGSCRSARPRPG